jgi:hypothetical protein
MPLARWQALCLDAVDARRLAHFWAGVLGLAAEDRDDGDSVVLRGARRAEDVWVNTVPEARVVKNRVHLDVRARSLDPLLAAGATVLRPEGDGGIGWTVLADPDGGEFCAFLRDDLPADPPARLYELVVDTADSDSSRALADWWAEVLGGRSVDDGRGFWWVADVAGAPVETIDVVPVPEPKSVKNRVHWDVQCDDVDALVARGATILRRPSQRVGWHVLADPQGNEFCAFPVDAVELG